MILQNKDLMRLVPIWEFLGAVCLTQFAPSVLAAPV